MPRDYGQLPTELQVGGLPSQAWAQEFESGEPACIGGTRSIGAWALLHGVGPACRARLVGACAEVIDNACRHAYQGGDGFVTIEARKRGRTLEITIEDRGLGMTPARSLSELGAEWCPGGLARAASLAERIQLESAPGLGTSVRLSFDVYRVHFDEERQIDLSDLDFFPPATARALIERLQAGESGDAFHLSPALAMTVGRLLSGPHGRRTTETSHRS